MAHTRITIIRTPCGSAATSSTWSRTSPASRTRHCSLPRWYIRPITAYSAIIHESSSTGGSRRPVLLPMLNICLNMIPPAAAMMRSSEIGQRHRSQCSRIGQGSRPLMIASKVPSRDAGGLRPSMRLAKVLGAIGRTFASRSSRRNPAEISAENPLDTHLRESIIISAIAAAVRQVLGSPIKKYQTAHV
jgi:hypothetical protein